MNKQSRIFIAGHRGMVGSALLRALGGAGFNNTITAAREELDLCNTQAVEAFFRRECPDYVLLAAAKVGGIQANREFPADFIYNNLMIQTNVIHHAYLSGVRKLVFLGSSCIYPRDCPQPMKEEHLLTGPLEPTNEAYAIAKIAGMKMVQFYGQQHGLRSLTVMPCNLYGPNDSFDSRHSHVLSALVKKFVDAIDEKKDEVILWGSGVARREFLHVDDLAEAILFLMRKENLPQFINVGSGTDISIRELAELISNKVNYRGKIDWDTSMPDGMLRKCMEISKLTKLGFRAKINLEKGIGCVIDEYRRVKGPISSS